MKPYTLIVACITLFCASRSYPQATISVQDQYFPNQFLCITVGDKNVILCDATVIQKGSDALNKIQPYQKSTIGNAFIAKVDSLLYMCTTSSVGGKISDAQKILGTRIVMVKENLDALLKLFLQKRMGEKPYEISSDIQDGDTVTITGYVFNKDYGMLLPITISGTGRIQNAFRVREGTLPDAADPYERFYFLPIAPNHIQLGGFAGSPALNAQGKVIGVASGITLVEDKKYLLVSLF